MLGVDIDGRRGRFSVICAGILDTGDYPFGGDAAIDDNDEVNKVCEQA